MSMSLNGKWVILKWEMDDPCLAPLDRFDHVIQLECVGRGLGSLSASFKRPSVKSGGVNTHSLTHTESGKRHVESDGRLGAVTPERVVLFSKFQRSPAISDSA